MHVAVKLANEPDARSAERFSVAADATLRPFRKDAERIRIVDMSVKGCGFESRWPFQDEMMVLLYLPGLEPWAAIVKWWRDGRGGIEFVRPLHPAVADRFAATIGGGGNQAGA